MRTHQEIDKRSLALHRLVAEKIRQDPALFEKAKATLARWMTIVGASSQPYLERWERLMNQGLDVNLAVATEDSERASAMRQASPFAGILTDQERKEFLLEWNRKHGGSEQEIEELRKMMAEADERLARVYPELKILGRPKK